LTTDLLDSVFLFYGLCVGSWRRGTGERERRHSLGSASGVHGRMTDAAIGGAHRVTQHGWNEERRRPDTGRRL
jgi:hypothetical protein